MTLMEQPKLSVVIPLRTNGFDFYRSRLLLRDKLRMRQIETLVVDDGSPEPVAKQIEDFCIERSYRYVRLDTQENSFSLSRARNAGLTAAQGKFVYMDDADLAYPCNFFESVVSQLQVLENTPFNFLSFPAVYLAESASAKVLEDQNFDSAYPRIIQALLLEDPKGSPRNLIVKNYAPASGVVALRRDLALSLGGYDEEFSGWGGEDRDFVFRLLADNPEIELPASFCDTESWNLNDTLIYRGWRSLHRLHGEFMARQGLYAVHLYHPDNAWRSQFSSARNMKRAAVKTRKTTIVDRRFESSFDLRNSILFDIYRASALVEKTDESTVHLPELIQVANRTKDIIRKDKVKLSKNKVRKLLVSPRTFFADSRFLFFRVFARIFWR